MKKDSHCASISVAAVVLAAGRSSRMKNKNKLLEELDDVPILHHVLNAIADSDVSETIVVLGHESEKIKSTLRGYELNIVDNPLYKSGIGSSIRKGVESLSQSIDGVLMILGDMPGITPRILKSLIENLVPEERKEICIPVCDNKLGNPVLWSKRFLPELCNLEGDIGGRCLFEEYSSFLVYCPMNTDAIHQDIDTDDQLQSIRDNARKSQI